MSTKVATDIDVQIGATVRRLREAKGLTQAGLASGIGVTFQQVQKYERGANRISASTMVSIADVLRCTVADLYDEPDPSGSSVSERGLLRVWAKLKPAEQRSVLEMLTEFAKR